MTTTTKPARLERNARIAVSALFLTNGALFANLIPHYPGIKSDLGLANAPYGIAIAMFPTGALLAGLAAGFLIRTLGSARTAVFGTALTGVGTLLAALAPSVWTFGAALLFAGAMDAITDVAQNSHGLQVQRRYGKTIINSFHAIWSVGAVTGGLMAAAAIALDMPRQVHLTISAVLFAVVAFIALRFCLPTTGDEATPDSAAGAAPAAPTVHFGPRVLVLTIALVVIAIAGTLVEDAGNSWATLYLTTLGAPAAIAAYGYIALVGAQFVGRLLGDGLVDRFGQRAVARAGGVIAAAGMGAALLFPSIPGTIAGFAAAGFGVATLVPAAMQEADDLPGLRPGTGLTLVSWLMRIGFLLSPPVVGLVADTAGLRVGLAVVPLAGVLAFLLAFTLRRRTTTTTS